MKNNRTSPCYNRKTHSDCPRKSSDCRRHCKAWKEYAGGQNSEYDHDDVNRRGEKANRTKLRKQQRKQKNEDW